MSYYMWVKKTSSRVSRSKVDKAFAALKKNADYVLEFARDCDRKAFPKAKNLQELLYKGLGLYVAVSDKGAVEFYPDDFHQWDDQFDTFCRVTEVLRKYMPKNLKMTVIGEDHETGKWHYSDDRKEWVVSRVRGEL